MDDVPTDEDIIEQMRTAKDLYRRLKDSPESEERDELIEEQRHNFYILRECLSDNDSEISDGGQPSEEEREANKRRVTCKIGTAAG